MIGRAMLVLFAAIAAAVGTALGLDALGVARHWSAWAAGLSGAVTAIAAGLFPPHDDGETSHGG